VPKAFAAAYGLPSIPTTEEMQGIADNWRPYRTWGAFLLRVMREEDTHEIAAIASSK